MHTVWLGLGTNLGCKEENLRQAIYTLEQQIGLLLKCSSFVETLPWGFQSSHSFLNAAVSMNTRLSPEDVLTVTKDIEISMGRLHKSVPNKYADRIIDIDILFYDDLVMNTSELTIPHPLLTRRSFVLKPLDEIAPNLVHPINGKSVHALLLALEEESRRDSDF